MLFIAQWHDIDNGWWCHNDYLILRMIVNINIENDYWWVLYWFLTMIMVIDIIMKWYGQWLMKWWCWLICIMVIDSIMIWYWSWMIISLLLLILIMIDDIRMIIKSELSWPALAQTFHINKRTSNIFMKNFFGQFNHERYHLECKDQRMVVIKLTYDYE